MLYSHASTISHHAMTAMVVSLHLVPDTLPMAIVALSASQPSASSSVRAGTKYVVTVYVFSGHHSARIDFLLYICTLNSDYDAIISPPPCPE